MGIDKQRRSRQLQPYDRAAMVTLTVANILLEGDEADMVLGRILYRCLPGKPVEPRVFLVATKCRTCRRPFNDGCSCTPEGPS